MNNLQNSIERAQKLFGHNKSDVENFYSIKIKPEHGGCCCFHCWPHTWQKINKQIQPNGPLKDEGDVLIKDDGYEFVLECHESGPEIVVLIDRVVNYSGFIISIVGLIITLLQSRQKEKPGFTFEIIKRKLKNGNIKEEIIIKTNHLSVRKDEIEKALSDHLKKNK